MLFEGHSCILPVRIAGWNKWWLNIGLHLLLECRHTNVAVSQIIRLVVVQPSLLLEPSLLERSTHNILFPKLVFRINEWFRRLVRSRGKIRNHLQSRAAAHIGELKGVAPCGHVPQPLAGAPRLLRIDRVMTLALKLIFTPIYLVEHWKNWSGGAGPAFRSNSLNFLWNLIFILWGRSQEKDHNYGHLVRIAVI